MKEKEKRNEEIKSIMDSLNLERLEADSITPGEIPIRCFTNDTSILKEGQMYLCRCELDGEPFYQMLPFIDGKLQMFSDFCIIISFAKLP